MSLTNEISNLQRYYGKNPDKQKSIEDEQKDEIYKEQQDNSSKENLSKLKDGVANNLGYGKFQIPGEIKEENNGNSIENIDIKKFEEKPGFPIINRFNEIPGIQISPKEIISIFEGIGIDNKKENIIETIKDSIKNIKFDLKETKQYLIKYLNKIIDNNEKNVDKGNEKNENKKELPKIFKEYSFLNNQEDYEVQLLAKNYLILPDGVSGKPDDNKDLETSFQITVNKIIDGKHFYRNESFETAMKDIKNGPIEDKFYALKYINSLVQTSEGSKSGKNSKDYEKSKNNHKVIEKQYLEFKIEKIEKLILDTKNNKEKEKLQEELNKLNELNEKLKKRDVKGEVFEGGKIDIQKGPESKEEQI